MSKIYETKQDVDRDIIADKIEDGERNKEVFLGLTAISGLLATLYFEIDSMGEQLLAHAKNVKDHVWGSDNAKGWLAVGAGVVSTVMYFVSRSETNKAKREAKKLGHQNVIYPKHEVIEVTNSPDLNNQHVARLESSKGNLKQDSLSR